ncbi:MAG: metallophosphoesterase [Candidatus Eremiobacteraeota bacterium]|nr:metallophosphoesterase [Candidatus Eremiobacteraeota bacterium]
MMRNWKRNVYSRAALIILFIFCLFTAQVVVFASDYTFSAMCDSRGNDDGVNKKVLSLLLNHLVKNNPSNKFILFPGDMISGKRGDPTALRKQLIKWKQVMSPIYDNIHMEWPYVWPSIGNHETINKEDMTTYLNFFNDVYMNGPKDERGLTYSFDYKNSHFVSVQTNHYVKKTKNDPYGLMEQYIKDLDWLEKDLSSARKRGIKHIFVFGHMPAFPIGAHLADSLPNANMILKNPKDPSARRYLKQRDKFWDVLVKYKVSAYICGHEHCYGRQRIRGVYQILTGGAGAPLCHLNPLPGDNKAKDPDWPPERFDEAKPFYEILGYPHGPKDKCQASNNFVGGRFFEYVIFNVSDNAVLIQTWGIDPKEGSRDQVKPGAKIELKDEFIIRN